MPTKLKYFLEAIKVEHTVFALPFAYIGMVLAAGGWPGWRIFFWITVAMVGARTLALAINRLADPAPGSLAHAAGGAAAGAGAAVRASIDLPAYLLWFAVTVWIAGFDLLYACQDVEFDRRGRLPGVPRRFGG